MSRSPTETAGSMQTLPPAILQQRFAACLASLNAGDLRAASAACEALLAITPQDAAVLQLHATIALRRGDAATALRSIEQSLTKRPGHGPALLIAARAAAMLGDPSMEAWVAAALGHAGHAGEFQSLALALQRAHKPGLALAAFGQATQVDPSLAPAWFGQGLLLREAGRMEPAREALHRAVALGPTAAAWFALGLTQQDLGDEAEAVVAYAAALALRADFAEAAVNLGIAQQRTGDMEAAMVSYRRAVAIRPNSLGRIAQAMTTASTGMLWLSSGALRQALGLGASGAVAPAVDARA